MANVNIGIVGTGSIVHNYKKCIDELPDANLVALYTKSPSRMAVAEKEFGAPVFSSMDTFLEQDINLVCICNESGRHGEAIKSAARAGKHVLSEKPLEVTPEKIDEVIQVCKEQDVKLGCTLQNRCGSDYRRVAEAVSSGKLGNLLMGNAQINWYRPGSYYSESDWKGTMEFDGGAAFINQGIHTIDLLLNLMGPVRSVFGKVDTLAHDIEGEDVGAAVLNFENGAIGNITAGTALYPGYPERIEIYGEKGSILMEGGQIKAWNIREESLPEQPSSKKLGSRPSSPKNPSSQKAIPKTDANDSGTTGASDPSAIGHANHKMIIADMIEAIRKNRAPMVDGQEARKAVAVIDAIYKSSKQERLVFL